MAESCKLSFMVKLTVIYNLHEGADHEAFVKWRVKEGQADRPRTLSSGIGFLQSRSMTGQELFRKIPQSLLLV